MTGTGNSGGTRPAGPADLALPLALVHDLVQAAAHGPGAAGKHGGRRRSRRVRR
ncbi:hypothetical protein ACWCXE_19880 [Streptomyces sp. NPDC001780]|uniref:hypothetical protein n=1 Tax=Streptomyces hebeiensis TaxID=229486 RepID=UPI0031D91212